MLKEYEEKGWIMSHEHKDLPLIIWNYTQKTQYEGYWDEVTLNCRGMVTDTLGNVVSKGFKKFFNYEEGKTNIPDMDASITVYEKLDGSYIQAFYYNDQWILNSKGSFYSDHVHWAKEIFFGKPLHLLNTDFTYCFELIHPENRIVVDYEDKKDLIFLTAFHKGVEMIIPMIHYFEPVYKYMVKGFDYDSLKENVANKEGYVVRFSNGQRCKIKHDEYIRLHRIMTDVSSYRVYEALKEGIDLEEWLKDVPDEFYDWIKQEECKIRLNFENLKLKILQEFYNINEMQFKTDKEFALYVKDYTRYPSCMFSLRNNKSIKNYIWKNIKPELRYPFKDES